MLWAARMALAGAMFAGISTSAIGAHSEPNAGHAASSPAQNESQDGQWLAVDQRQGCRALDVNFDDGDTVSWTGDCRNGFAEGAGTLTFSNDGAVVETITATLRRGTVQNGHVVVAWSDGSKYEGDEASGHMNGAGVFTSAKGDRLEGPWTNDVLCGRVRIAWADGDRYDGDWHDGAQNGQGTEIWANGDRYDGDWRDGKAEGTGSQKWADGRAYSGAWHDDQPMQTVARAAMPSRPVAMAAPSAPNLAAAPQAAVAMTTGSANVAVATASVPATLMAQAASTPTSATLQSQNVAPPVTMTNTMHAAGAVAPANLVASSANAAGQTAILEGLAGTQLVSVDGSSIAFTATEAGFTRDIARPDGARQATSFNFINDRLGTITSADDPSQTIGLFRVTDSEIDVNYADGRSEVLTPNRNGGLSIALAAPNAGVYCMSWYPQGHLFSDAERKAAVAAYANRLGTGSTAAPPSDGSCTGGATTKTAAAPAAPVAPQSSQASTTNLQNVPRPIPKPMRVSFVRQAPPPWSPPAQAPFAQNTSGVVVVRDSVVHPIDADADASIPATVQASLAPTKLPDSASSCLTVDSDGAHWGFRNHCGYSVQFSYCLMNDPDGLAGCHDGGVAGSVAPNGFGALVADKSIKESGGDHDFRWIACSGGAGEVVPHLDHSDPPAGRCVRPKAS
jgi:hypothetical protein